MGNWELHPYFVIVDTSKYRDGKKFFIANVGLIATKKSILGDNEVSGRNSERARRRGVLGNGQRGDGVREPVKNVLADFVR